MTEKFQHKYYAGTKTKLFSKMRAVSASGVAGPRVNLLQQRSCSLRWLRQCLANILHSYKRQDLMRIFHTSLNVGNVKTLERLCKDD